MPPIRLFARNMHVKIKESEITIEFSMSYLALSVPRTELQILQLATLNYIHKYPVLQLITKYNCEFQFR